MDSLVEAFLLILIGGISSSNNDNETNAAIQVQFIDVLGNPEHDVSYIGVTVGIVEFTCICPNCVKVTLFAKPFKAPNKSYEMTKMESSDNWVFSLKFNNPLKLVGRYQCIRDQSSFATYDWLYYYASSCKGTVDTCGIVLFNETYQDFLLTMPEKGKICQRTHSFRNTKNIICAPSADYSTLCETENTTDGIIEEQPIYEIVGGEKCEYSTSFPYKYSMFFMTYDRCAGKTTGQTFRLGSVNLIDKFLLPLCYVCAANTILWINDKINSTFTCNDNKLIPFRYIFDPNVAVRIKILFETKIGSETSVRTYASFVHIDGRAEIHEINIRCANENKISMTLNCSISKLEPKSEFSVTYAVFRDGHAEGMSMDSFLVVNRSGQYSCRAIIVHRYDMSSFNRLLFSSTLNVSAHCPVTTTHSSTSKIFVHAVIVLCIFIVAVVIIALGIWLYLRWKKKHDLKSLMSSSETITPETVPYHTYKSKPSTKSS